MSALDCLERLADTNIPNEDLRYCLASKEKIPHKIDGTRASTDNYEDFVTFDEVLSSSLLEEFAGLGISIQASKIIAIDLDHCVEEPLNIHTANQQTLDIIDLFKDFAYIEFSFSGKGIRILTRQHEIENYRNNYYIKNSNLGIEFYQPAFDGVVSNRYVTITGNTIYDNSLNTENDYTDRLKFFLDKYMKKENKHVDIKTVKNINPDKTIDQLRRILKRWLIVDQSFQDDWFKDGIHPTKADKDESERDFRILTFLYTHITTDDEKIRTLFEESIFFKTKDGSHIKKWEYNDHRYFKYQLSKIKEYYS